MSKKSNRFSLEVRQRAVRLVQEHRGEYVSLWAAIESIAPKIGCVPQTLHEPIFLSWPQAKCQERRLHAGCSVV